MNMTGCKIVMGSSALCASEQSVSLQLFLVKYRTNVSILFSGNIRFVDWKVVAVVVIECGNA